MDSTERIVEHPCHKMIIRACAEGAMKHWLGQMSFDEALDYAVNRCEQLMDTDGLKQELRDYLSNFVSVKEYNNGSDKQN